MQLTNEQERFIEATLTGALSCLLLGKAGVGKSACVNEIIKRATERSKRFFVLAPTGVAALNIKGETVHRFLIRLRRELNIRIYKPDFILIDECSMMRADLLDQLDEALQRATGNKKPFGDVPVILIGDCAQLPPVVKNEDKQQLLDKYSSAWFFSSYVFSKIDWRIYELTHIFRQSEVNFIELLNKIREGESTEAVQWLNENRQTDLARGTILVSTNKAAQEINLRQLNKLGGATNFYDCEIIGDLTEKDYPTETQIALCIGARIMCIKNIYEAGELVLVNGDTGQVVECLEEGVVFFCDRTQETHMVSIENGHWDKVERVLEDGETKERVLGTFIQLPIKLAWAMTVHKSQGATLHEVTLDMRTRFFAEGQAYVALSRGSSMERLWLYGQIRQGDIVLSHEARDFLNNRLKSKFIHKSQNMPLFE